jgi:ribosome biogenesis GTPase
MRHSRTLDGQLIIMFDESDQARWRAIGWTAQDHAAAQRWLEDHCAHEPAVAGAPVPSISPYRVVEVQRDHVLLHDGHDGHATHGARRARVPHALQRQLAQDADALAVGDWVLAECGEGLADLWVRHRLPPRNQLARRLHDGRDKVARVVIVSNVDTAVLVMGLDHDYNPRRLQRYLALTRMAGVPAVVVLTKADLDPEAGLRQCAELQEQVRDGTPVLALSALDPQAPRALQPWLQPGQTLVLLGSSGAGKSTLTNALCAANLQDTGPVRAADSHGRHTTTVRSLHRAPGGACIIDTPGLRTLRLDGDEEALQHVFDDVARAALQCRFRDCQHQDEPGCAVRASVEPERLLSWRKLQREARRDQMSALERQRQLSEWKQRSRAGRERSRDKRA